MSEEPLPEPEGSNSTIPDNFGGENLNNSDAQFSELGGQVDANAIKYQIDVSEYMEQIERFLRGEVKLKNEETGEYYYGLPKIKKRGKEVPDESKKVMNDYGVGQIMNVIHFYINKHLALSKFDEKRIYEILLDLCTGLRRYMLGYTKKLGINDKDKTGAVNVIVMNVINVIESCYRRAMNGMTIQTLNQSTLNSSPAPMGTQLPAINVNTGPANRPGILNPRRWFGSGR